MTNDKIKLAPVSLSDLPEIGEPSGFWLFGSKEDENGVLKSGRYSLDNFLEFSQQIQLERRMSFSMESTDMELYFDEPMNIYRLAGDNILGVKITIKGKDHSANVDTNVSIEIPAKSKVSFSLVRKSTDTKMFLFIYAKAKLH